MAKEQLGTLACLCCNREIPVKKSTGGALSACCPWCDLSAYAKEGTEAHRLIAGRMRRSEPQPGAEPAAASGSASDEGPLQKAEKAKKRRETSEPPAQVPAAASAATPAPAPKKSGGSIWDELYGPKPA
mgnify:CR=1